MTENEAIELLKNNYPKTCKMVDGRLRGGFDDHECDVGIAIDLAIKALKEVQEYRKIGTPEECRAAMKKKQEKPMEEFGVFGNPEEKDLDRLESLHHKILYSKITEIVTEQEMIAFIRAKIALKKQISKMRKSGIESEVE